MRQDIANGRKNCHSMCPIALALKRNFPHQKVLVGIEWLQVGPKDYRCDRKAKDFIYSFDRGEEVKPVTVSLEEI